MDSKILEIIIFGAMINIFVIAGFLSQILYIRTDFFKTWLGTCILGASIVLLHKLSVTSFQDVIPPIGLFTISITTLTIVTLIGYFAFVANAGISHNHPFRFSPYFLQVYVPVVTALIIVAILTTR